MQLDAALALGAFRQSGETIASENGKPVTQLKVLLPRPLRLIRCRCLAQ
jgi:hypothetical protein